MKDALYVVIAVGVVAFFIVRQRRSDRFRERSLLFPLALGVYGAVLLTQTSEHRLAHDRIRRAAALERGRVNRLRRDSRPDDRALHARRRTVGTSLVDDDRCWLGRARGDTNCADRGRCSGRRQGCVIAHLHPTDARNHACDPDARGEGARKRAGRCRGGVLASTPQKRSPELISSRVEGRASVGR